MWHSVRLQTLLVLCGALIPASAGAQPDPVLDFILAADSVNTASGEAGLVEWLPDQPDLSGAALARLIDIGVQVGDDGNAEGEAENGALVEALAAAHRQIDADSALAALLAEYRGWDADARSRRAAAIATEDEFWAGVGADPDSALAMFQRVDAVYEEISDSHSRARVWGKMGAANWYRGDVEAVQECYLEALRRRRGVQDRMLEAATLNGLGSVHARLLGDLPGAIDWYGQAVDMRRAIGDTAGLATSLTYKANVHRDLGQMVEARSLYEEARPVLLELDNLTAVAENVYGTALLYDVSGRPADALRLYEESVELCMQAPDCGYAPTFLVEMADQQRRLGMVHDCFASLQRAEDLLDANPDPVAATRLWQVRALASIDLGDQDGAREQVLQALRLARESGNLTLQSDSSTLIAGLYLNLGAPDRARASAEEGLRIARDIEDPALERAAVYTLARIALREGSGEEAADYFTAALELDEQAAASIEVAQDLVGRGGAWSLMGRNEEARADLRRATALLIESNREASLWITHLNMADTFEESHADSAAYYYDAALASLEDASSSSGGEALNTGYLFANRGMAYEEITRYYATRHREDPLGGWDAKAFETAERSRARGLLDLLESSFALDSGPEALAVIDSLYQVDTSTPEGRAQRDELNSRLATLRAARRTESVGQSLEPVGLLELRKRKPTQTIILQYAVGDSVTLLWVIDNKATELHELPGRAELRRRVKAFRSAIAQPGAADEAMLSEGHALYEILVKVAEVRIGRRKNLVIVPDDVLFELPFSALLTEAATPGDPWSEQPFFGRSKRPVYAPSSTVYLRLRKQKAGKFDRELLAAGDVDYSGLEPALEPLPYTREEVSRIPHKLKPGKQHLLLGADATESQVRVGLQFGSTRVVHLATHGLIDPAEPMRSCVALGAGRGDDGYLYSLEILSLELDRPMIVLSACESALGRLERGEGVVGLTRSFLAAGSRGVVASLWPVSDESTASLMEEFYRALWKKYSAGESLRQARNILLQTEEWGHPYFWAAFVTIGTEKTPW